jgi:hypothetical protein
MTKIVRALVLVGGLIWTPLAFAGPVKLPTGAKVTFIEATYLPGSVRFKLSLGDATCPAGSTFVWSNPSTENVKMVMSLLMAAKLSNQSVYAWYEGSTGCPGGTGTVTFIGLE